AYNARMPDDSKPLQQSLREQHSIRIRGARQHNLKNLSLDIPTGEITVVTGVSGSGKSSLVFDTLYAEGQRRYVETFSPYARQFLDRMDKPQVESIEGVPPAIAIDQTNPVRTSRSTVGTMTELTDHLKLFYARLADLYCQGCGEVVKAESSETVYDFLCAQAASTKAVVCFEVAVPANFTEAEVTQYLSAQGYSQIHSRSDTGMVVMQDRFRVANVKTTEGRARAIEALEAAFLRGHGEICVFLSGYGEGAGELERRFNNRLACSACDLSYQALTPSHFSFNNPLGACESCRGFGRVIGVDYGLVVPDESKTLREGAIKPWQTESFKECQKELVQYAEKNKIRLDVPYSELTDSERRWVLEGSPEWLSWEKSWPKYFYGVRGYFKWLESKAYKMHIRVLLSKYRAYTACEDCAGARLKPASLNWRLGKALLPATKFLPRHVAYGQDKLAEMPGLSLHDVMLMPVAQTQDFFAHIRLSKFADEASKQLLLEIRARLGFLTQVGLGYLTLDRQSRTLSGGEVQRINLTTALGTSLTNTLFVLDEPSIGLHPRDMDRIIAVMQKLRDQGNTLVVVEHDPAMMFAADRLLDIGPLAGEAGGQILYQGPAAGIKNSHGSLTYAYLAQQQKIEHVVLPKPVEKGTARMKLVGANANNLQRLTVEFPLGRLVVVSGVSGAGKSSLITDVLVTAMYKAKGKSFVGDMGEHRAHYEALFHHQSLSDVVLVDQTPIGKSARSNPASYVGAYDAIRAAFADTDAARQRQFTAGTFSFNAGDGRCPTCSGAGFEHVEMQFLSDVYLRCADCDGRRFRSETLEVEIGGLSVAEVLQLTVAEALEFFAGKVSEKHAREINRTLKPLQMVGLSYVRLGQAVPTLSGGEAQRLKLALHLAESVQSSRSARVSGGKLFVFDEPTTGLHFADIALLLKALMQLRDQGHSLIVVEHNLDVIAAADWLIELGPEGGNGGGQIVFEGSAAALAKAKTHTGQALRDFAKAQSRWREQVAQYTPKVAQPKLAGAQAISVAHAREHNLKNISLTIPHKGFTVITGVSGSGKSTLAFDIVFAEGQRRYLDSLNAYARQFVQPPSKPDVDGIFGIPPTVAIEQRTSRGGRKSTVATLTEIYHYLRL
ncbi:MAG: UvrABC system protein, partial [Pseudomonadota bacterium]